MGQRRLSAWGRKGSTLAGCRMYRSWSRTDAAELQCWSLSTQSSSQGLQPDGKMPEKQMPCHANTALDIFISTWSHVPERCQQQWIPEYANSRVGNAEKH